MDISRKEDVLWVVVVLDSQLFAINCSDVKELVAVPSVSRMPGMPDFVRGIVNLRGTVLPLIDLRIRLGMRSRETEIEEFCAMLRQRAEDHRRWVDELQRSVNDGCEFTLATDPHQCAFGKWYDSYKTDEAVATELLRHFDEPHQQIHSIAVKVKSLLAQEKGNEAHKLIEVNRKGALATMLKLFNEFETAIRASRREKAVVITVANARSYAVCVDSIVAVERLERRAEALKHGVFGDRQNIAESVLERKGRDELVISLSTGLVLSADMQAGLQREPDAAVSA